MGSVKNVQLLASSLTVLHHNVAGDIFGHHASLRPAAVKAAGEAPLVYELLQQ